MAWVDLGDLYVKKAGDNVTGSIVMANNNLSVAYDADTTYNVGTEIKSLRDSVNKIGNVSAVLPIKYITFAKNLNGNYEIWFSGDEKNSFNVCFNFSNKHLGFWDQKTGQAKNLYFS